MSSDNESSKSIFSLALGGILIALGWIFVVLSGVFPTGRLFLLLLASLVVATSCFEMKFSGAVLVALGISLLSLAYPGPIHAAVFALFAGPLPLLMLVFYRRQFPVVLQYLINHTLLSLLLVAVLSILGLHNFITNRINVEAGLIWFIILAVFQILLLVYRYILFNYETFYYRRISPWMNRK